MVDCRYIVSEEWRCAEVEINSNHMQREMNLVLVTGASDFLGQGLRWGTAFCGCTVEPWTELRRKRTAEPFAQIGWETFDIP